MRSTAFLASGATTSTTGNAISQAVSQPLIHNSVKFVARPLMRNVEMPETSRDISPESRRPNNMGANFLEIM